MDKEEVKIVDEKKELVGASDKTEEISAEETPEEEGLELEDELDRLKDRHLRLQAEYANYRRRTEEEKSKIYSFANEKLILELLPIIDNFARALGNMKENDVSKSYKDGVKMIEKSLMQVLEKQGLECIEACGKEFNPEFHHAVLTEASKEKNSGIILEELQKGYKLKDKTIRPTMVKVSK